MDWAQCFFVTVRAGTAYRKIWQLVNKFCSHNKVDCSEIPSVLSNLLYHYFFIELWHILISWLAKMPNGGIAGFYIDRYRMTSFEISIACWLLSRPNLRIVSKLTTDVVTYRYFTEASNQKSKDAYRKIFFYKKALITLHHCVQFYSVNLRGLSPSNTLDPLLPWLTVTVWEATRPKESLMYGRRTWTSTRGIRPGPLFLMLNRWSTRSTSFSGFDDTPSSVLSFNVISTSFDLTEQ